MTRKTALILNFTAPVYHWGCYATSTELYATLQERRYLVNWWDVRTTHTLEPSPSSLADFNSGPFLSTFFGRNKALYHALSDADVIVVNGEGTLHRLSAGARSLLYVMHVAQNALRKPVYLLNHSLFPSGSLEPEATADRLYGEVVGRLTRVVPREPYSAAVLQRLGLNPPQGFDCLPRFVARQSFVARPSAVPSLVVSGGVTQSTGAARQVARTIAAEVHGTEIDLIFLTGAKSRPAAEDRETFEAMRPELPSLRWFEAPTMEAWLSTLGAARCLVSARFHHTIAALTLGTPVVVFPSNTPKTEGVCFFLQIPAPVPETVEGFAQAQARIREALAGGGIRLTTEARERMLAGAAENFVGL